MCCDPHARAATPRQELDELGLPLESDPEDFASAFSSVMEMRDVTNRSPAGLKR